MLPITAPNKVPIAHPIYGKVLNRDEDTTKERKVDLEDITIETSKTEKQREKTNQKKKTEYQEL